MKDKKKQKEIIAFIKNFDNSYEIAVGNAQGKYHLNRKQMLQVLKEEKMPIPVGFQNLSSI